MYRWSFSFIFVIIIVATVRITASQGNALDSDAITKEIGVQGERKADVYRLSLPRTDLNVTVDSIKLNPGFALGTWIAFKGTGGQSVAHGDLVLIETEVAPVVAQLEQDGIQITGLHNHLIHESPRILYLHFWGQGEASTIARNLKKALNLTHTPMGEQKRGQDTQAFPEAESILKVLGQKGEAKNGVLKVSVPRPEPITMTGIDLPPSMGMATALNFQSAADGKVAATGDFVMTGAEVGGVAKALTEGGITITALHNHLVHESPPLYFMHFWAHDRPDKIGAALKAAIDALKTGQ